MDDCSFDWGSWVVTSTGARAIERADLLQNLWGGYGQLLRLTLAGGPLPSVILKRVLPPDGARESVSDQRKRRSYQVEQAWYQSGSRSCDEACRVARCLAVERRPSSTLILLEDLTTAGFHASTRGQRPSAEQVGAGLRWLAHFHARFLGQSPPGLWEQGGYWHLDTRPEEWQRMPTGPLKQAAAALDERLKTARFQTLMHGDAKPANFCWHANGSAAAVDFQYVGPGCGIRDVSYFLDSCLGESGCQSDAPRWLDRYFAALHKAMKTHGNDTHAQDLEAEWRAIYPVAWADFCRFEQGWRGPSSLGSYSQEQLRQALHLLGS